MTDRWIENVYLTLTGHYTKNGGVPGVENAFAPGSFCMEQYMQMHAAYERLCERLGVEDEDEDVEIIIRAFMYMEREVSMKMYRYGAKFESMK